MARRKPRLFAFEREVELANLQLDSSTPPEVVRLLADAIDAFAAIASVKLIQPGDLDDLVRAARHPDPKVRGLGLTRLSVLTHYFPEAVATYASLVRDPDPAIRRFAVTVLANTGPEVVGALLPVALNDADWSVRKAAATVAGALPLPSLQPVFTQHLARESDARVRVVLQLAVEHQHRIA